MKTLASLVAIAALLASGGVLAQTGAITPEKDPHAAHHATDAKPNTAFSDGEVRKVDKDAGKITLKHGPIANLDMPAMSMVFRAKDPAMLDQVKEGDRIRFKADKIQGAITLTEIRPVN